MGNHSSRASSIRRKKQVMDRVAIVRRNHKPGANSFRASMNADGSVIRYSTIILFDKGLLSPNADPPFISFRFQNFRFNKNLTEGKAEG
jgi:hypothetical protein